MYAGDLLEQLQWDTLYHEHLTFYSLQTLDGLLRRFGFETIDAERIPMHGGSLRIAAVRTGRRAKTPRVAELAGWEEQVVLNDPATWDGFAAAMPSPHRRVRGHHASARRRRIDLGLRRRGQGDHVGQCVRYDLPRGRRRRLATPRWRLMPGTHTPIVSPEKFKAADPDYVFASAWNYLDAIRANEPQYTGYWIVPLPEMRVY